MKISLLRTFAVLFAFGIVASACGGDDNTVAGGDALAISLADEMRSSGETPEVLGDTDIDCLANAMSKAVGGESGMEDEYGITVAEFADLDNMRISEGDATKLVDGLDGCMDLRKLMADGIVGEGIDQAAADCVAEAFDLDLVKTAFIGGFSGSEDAFLNPAFVGEAQNAAVECGLG